MTDLPRGLLVDLDDTILAFSASAEPTWWEVCGSTAVELGAVTPEGLFRGIRAAARAFWDDPERARRGRLDLERSRRAIVADALQALGVGTTEIATRIADRYTLLRDERVWVFPGARGALSAFHARGVRLALVTNGGSKPQRRKIERFHLDPLFDRVLIEEEAGVGKPDAGIFRAALEGLGLCAEEAWMVGDNLEADIAGAQRVGLQGVWCDWRGEGLPEGSSVRPDRIVRSLRELAS